MRCKVCSTEKTDPEHDFTEKHLKNKALYEYSVERKNHTSNKKGAVVKCNVKSSFTNIIDNADPKIKIPAKPNEELKFQFTVFNDSETQDLLLDFIEIPSNKMNFIMNNNGLRSGCVPQCIKPKKRLHQDVHVTFRCSDIGEYQMPIAFLFRRKDTNEKIFISRDMVVYVEETQTKHQKLRSPYIDKEVTADMLIKTSLKSNTESFVFRIPKNYKAVYASGLTVKPDASDEVKAIAEEISDALVTGVTEDNYVRFFHTLLWYEETIVRINLKKYNMSGVHLRQLVNNIYSLVVPGLAEKRPSLLIGDLLFIKPASSDAVMFEGVISEIQENTISIKGLHREFAAHFAAGSRVDVRFFMSRMPLERMHRAVHAAPNHMHRLFPTGTAATPPAPALEFFNKEVGGNAEQRRWVQLCVAGGGGGGAPLLLHGPPGTGKTVTLAEAALQLAQKAESNRILICTDSNMAADHVASVLARYAHRFKGALLLRANSKYRVWQTLPKCLFQYSNGTDMETFESVSKEKFLENRIIVTTLLHSAKFATQFKSERPITHLFIDEAAQASEPACLVPLCGLLRKGGRLMLAGDPLQLGPCVISHGARDKGLGVSLMERLIKMDLYQSENSDYVVMLRNNFRSSADIIELPNELFYKYRLRACAEEDVLSRVCLLGVNKSSRAVVFHGVLSQEQRVGKSPSYFNPMELELVQKYVTALINRHNVQPEDIGIVTPYIRQVYKVKEWLRSAGYGAVEAGTVEAFQGKEKRVVVISCVRARAALLDHDARYRLGFLVDDKRFNVALTRAKAKTIIIGNPVVLQCDEKWKRYMEQCRALGTYFGYDANLADADDARGQLLAAVEPLMADLRLAGAGGAR